MKNIPRLSFGYVILTVFCGAVVALFRVKNGTDLGLLIVAAAAVLILAAAAAAVRRFCKKYNVPQPEPGKLSFALIACAGFLFLATAFLFFLKGSGSSLLRAVSAVFAAVTGAAVLMRLSERDKTERAAGYSLVPIFLVGFYLLLLYRGNGDNPYLSEFGCEIAVFLLVLIGLYASVAGWFLKPRPILRPAAMSWGLAACVQEWLYFLLRHDKVLAIRGFSLGSMLLLSACAFLLAAALLVPPRLLPKPAPEQPDEKDAVKTEEE